MHFAENCVRIYVISFETRQVQIGAHPEVEESLTTTIIPRLPARLEWPRVESSAKEEGGATR